MHVHIQWGDDGVAFAQSGTESDRTFFRFIAERAELSGTELSIRQKSIRRGKCALEIILSRIPQLCRRYSSKTEKFVSKCTVFLYYIISPWDERKCAGLL